MIEPDLILRARLKDSCVTTAQFRRADLAPERDLHARKWFDYRFMSPSEATAIFRVEYEKVCPAGRLVLRELVNAVSSASTMRPAPPNGPLEARRQGAFRL
jgi:hypothetical protein